MRLNHVIVLRGGNGCVLTADTVTVEHRHDVRVENSVAFISRNGRLHNGRASLSTDAGQFVL